MKIDEIGRQVGDETRRATREAVDLSLALEKVTARRRRGPVRSVIPVALAVVVVVVGIFTVHLLGPNQPTGEELPAPAVSTPVPSPTPSSTPTERWDDLVEAQLVDLRTGQLRTLPASIRKIGPFTQSFEVSPDGSHFTFYGGDGQVYVSRVDGTDIRALSAAPPTAPSWSSDGRSIVFTDDNQLRVVNASTGAVEEVLTMPSRVLAPDFSSDDASILFTMNHQEAYALWTVPASEGADPELLLDRAAFGEYSPDGTTIAFRRTDFGGGPVTEMTNGGLWVAASSGRTPRLLKQTEGSMSQISSQALWPAWSPDGRRIAYQPLLMRDVVVVEFASGHIVDWVSSVETRREFIGLAWRDNHTLIMGPVPAGFD